MLALAVIGFEQKKSFRTAVKHIRYVRIPRFLIARTRSFLRPKIKDSLNRDVLVAIELCLPDHLLEAGPTKQRIQRFYPNE